MVDFSNNPAFYNKPIPNEKLFDQNTINDYGITDVIWLLSIKPGIRNVEKYVNDRVRMEEIEVISVRLTKMPDYSFHTRLLKQIHAKISYPCVVILHYNDKFKFSVWRFIDSAKDMNHNIMQGSHVSSWIHLNEHSEKLRNNTNQIYDLLLNGEGSLKDIYTQISSCVWNITPEFIGSRTHLERIIYDLTGKKNHPIIGEIPYSIRHDEKPSYSRYKKKEYYSSYKYFYEYEEIWHTFMENEQIKEIIKQRRYHDANEMIVKIDMKYDTDG